MSHNAHAAPTPFKLNPGLYDVEHEFDDDCDVLLPLAEAGKKLREIGRICRIFELDEVTTRTFEGMDPGKRPPREPQGAET